MAFKSPCVCVQVSSLLDEFGCIPELFATPNTPPILQNMGMAWVPLRSAETIDLELGHLLQHYYPCFFRVYLKYGPPQCSAAGPNWPGWVPRAHSIAVGQR